MKKFRILILIACVGLSSCIGTNIPKSEKRAKKRLSKHLTSIKNLTNTYPGLIDTFTLVVHDTIKIKSHSIDTVFYSDIDTNLIDNLLIDFVANSVGHSDGMDVRNTRQKERIRTIRNEIIKEVLKDTSFVYDDSLVHSTFTIKGGKFYYKSTVKEKKIPYVKEIITKLDTDCAIKKDFWQDWKFYILLLILFIAGYLRNKLNEKG